MGIFPLSMLFTTAVQMQAMPPVAHFSMSNRKRKPMLVALHHKINAGSPFDAKVRSHTTPKEPLAEGDQKRRINKSSYAKYFASLKAAWGVDNSN